jgi:hydrolase, TatD family
MKFIDTHTHLYDEAFDSDFIETINKVKESGIEKCIFPGIDSTTFNRQSKCADLCGDFVNEAIGLHPTSVGENWREELSFVESNIDKRKYVAVGEIGLDGYWSKEFMAEQKIVFKEQMNLAYRLKLPVIIHLREATEEVFEVLDSLKGNVPKGIFHAFSGSYQMYERICNNGDFLIGIGGVVTYKNAGVAKSLESIPLSKIVLETDSPYLTPVPFRGKRNDSSNIKYIAEKIAQIKNVDIEEVAKVTTLNAKEIFNIL